MIFWDVFKPRKVISLRNKFGAGYAPKVTHPRVAEYGHLKLGGHMIMKMNLEKVFKLFFIFRDTCLCRTIHIEKTSTF